MRKPMNASELDYKLALYVAMRRPRTVNHSDVELVSE